MSHLPKDQTVDSMEQHGCIVCGRVFTLLVIYDREGRLIDCAVTSPGGRRVEDAERPLVACTHHKPDAVSKAIARHYPGRAIEDLEDENEE
jgi:hypothetical protein